MKFEPKLYRLSNGIPVILDPTDIATASVKIVFKTGGRDEKPDELVDILVDMFRCLYAEDIDE